MIDMTLHSIMRSLQGQYFNVKYLVFVLSVTLLALAMLMMRGGEAFRSSEVRFSDASSRSGLPIVPASCPSYPHTEGECDCTASYYCDGDDRRYIDTTCEDSFVETCTYGCSGGACLAQDSIEFIPFTAKLYLYDEGEAPMGEGGNPGDPLEFEATGHLQVLPKLIRSGVIASVYWSVDHATACTVSGSNGDSWPGFSSGENGTTTSFITEQTIFTLHCEALEGAVPSVVEETETVNIIPTFEEV